MIAATEALATSWIAGGERGGLSSWIVRDAESGALLGNAGCSPRQGAWWNLGYRLAPEAQGRGIASRVATHALAEANRVEDTMPVVASLLEHNIASARVAQRAGLTLQYRGPDVGNPTADAVRLVFADRALSEAEVGVFLA